MSARTFVLRACRVLAVLLVFAAPSAAWCESSQRLAQAHMRKATQFFGAQKFAEALEELRTADALVSAPIVHYNIARCLEELGRIEEAIAGYQRYLGEKDVTAGSAKRAQASRDTIAALEARLGTLEVTCAGARAQVEIPKVEATSAPCPWRRQHLAAGDYEIKVTAPGFEAFTGTFALKGGEVLSVPVTLKPLPPPSPEPAPTADLPLPPAPLAPPVAQEHQRVSPSARQTAGSVLIGVGGAALAASALFAGLGAYNKYEIEQGRFESKAELEDANRLATGTYNPLAWGLLGGGAAVLVTGLVLRLLPGAPAGTSVSLETAPGGGGQVLVSGTWP